MGIVCAQVSPLVPPSSLEKGAFTWNYERWDVQEKTSLPFIFIDMLCLHRVVKGTMSDPVYRDQISVS